jgi:hypothetical protein
MEIRKAMSEHDDELPGLPAVFGAGGLGWTYGTNFERRGLFLMPKRLTRQDVGQVCKPNPYLTPADRIILKIRRIRVHGCPLWHYI